MSNQAKQQIQQTLRQFRRGGLRENGRLLLAALGYESERQLDMDSRPADFLTAFDPAGILRQDKALLADWRSVDILCQLTDREIKQSEQMILFESAGKVVDNSIMESYLFVAVALRGERYTRTQLAQATREINKLFNMPAMLLFRHGDALTLSIINRRLHKRDRSKDVLEKVTLIKDIRLANPHRAHIEILFDLSLDELRRQHDFTNFVELHRIWQKTLDSSELNKRFFKEIADWYFWAVDQVVFPDEAGPDETRNATSVIRLITRLIFVWFIKEKGLIPDDLFSQARLKSLLTWADPQESTYYKAILQNLFFATLNQEMNTPAKPDNRKFRGTRANGRDQHFMIHNVYRYERYFTDPPAALELFAGIPFLNGGLFECLDRKEGKRTRRVDGFSDRSDNPLRVPDQLFFGGEQTVDLNQVYDTSGKRYTVRGLIHILNRYKFTITENTPIEEEVALDPELLGKVFENLLAAYNPETGTTARKQTGSFYTPREIVNYMVDESLVAYLVALVARASSPHPDEQDSEQDSEQDARATNDEGEDDGQDARATVFFDPLAPLDIYQRNLPHWRQEGATYFITFRLADSLPQEKLQQLREEREAWLKQHKEPYSPAEKAEYHRLFSQRVEDWLDAGMGSCLLADPENGRIVAEALRFFDGERYRLGEWVVMPNHSHVLVTPLPGHKLEDILHSWKSFTANKINRRVGRSGPLWQEESYDRIIRNEAHLRRVEQYIANNPRKAGITVAHSSAGSSAGFQPADAQPAKNQHTKAVEGDGNGQDARATARATVEERLRHLLAYNEEPHQFNRAETEALITAINRLKILDPACGSGAFPMGILHKLVFILGKLDPDNARWKEEQIEQQIRPVQADIQIAERISDEEARAAAIDQLQERLAEIREKFERNEQDYPRKLFLIENCIYGVDIQPVAVQIAKLRFFISLVVDQRIDDAAPNRGILPLPNLETKFVAANTLLGIEKPAQMGLRNPAITEKEQELAEVRSKHFRARTPATKEKYRLEDKRLRAEIGRLLQKDGFPNETTALLANWDPYDQNARADFFDREWMFGLERGFDIVIGNPPYVRQEKIRPLKPALKEQYKCYTGIADLYVYFFENGVNLLREGGVLCYICSNKYFRAGYGKKLRQFLSRQTTIRQLIDFGDAPVFTAIAYPSIICLQKTSPNGSRLHAFNWEPGPAIAEFETVFKANRFTMPQAALTADGWRLESPEVLALLAKLRQMGKPLGEYVNGRFYRGILTGLNEAFVIDRATRDRLIAQHPSSAEIIKPFLRGRDVKRWQVTFDNQYLIKIESSANKRHPWTGKSDKEAEKIFAKTYPAIYAHFEPYRKRLIKRHDQGKYYWELRACAYWEEFEQSKIVYPDIAQNAEFAFDNNGYYVVNTMYLMPTDQLWLVGLLNSKTTFWFYTQISTKIRGGFVRFIAQYVAEIPVPKNSDTRRLEQLSRQILAMKEANHETDVSVLEQEIDQLVYELYRLTPAEIALIEGREVARASSTPGSAAAPQPPEGGGQDARATFFSGRPPQGSISEKIKRLNSLSQQSSPAAIQELVAALADDSDTIRWQAGAALRAIGGPQVAGVLQAFIAHTDSAVAQEAAERLLEQLEQASL